MTTVAAQSPERSVIALRDMDMRAEMTLTDSEFLDLFAARVLLHDGTLRSDVHVGRLAIALRQIRTPVS
jgi:hypothetical protein